MYLLGISQNPIQLHVVAALEGVGGSLVRKEVFHSFLTTPATDEVSLARARAICSEYCQWLLKSDAKKRCLSNFNSQKNYM